MNTHRVVVFRPISPGVWASTVYSVNTGVATEHHAIGTDTAGYELSITVCWSSRQQTSVWARCSIVWVSRISFALKQCCKEAIFSQHNSFSISISHWFYIEYFLLVVFYTLSEMIMILHSQPYNCILISNSFSHILVTKIIPYHNNITVS